MKGTEKMLGLTQHHSAFFDAAVLGVVMSSWFQVIPSVAAFLAIVWYCILIWESQTVRHLTKREVEDYEEPSSNIDYGDEGKS